MYREVVNSISQSNLDPKEFWTLKGIYLAFIRMNIDLEQRYKTEEITQERIVGRDKETCCSIIGVRNREKIDNGHMVISVGYDDKMAIKNEMRGKETKGALITRNSWNRVGRKWIWIFTLRLCY